MIQIKNKTQMYILFTTIILVMTGFIMVCSSTTDMATRLYGNKYYFVIRQGIWIMISLLAMVGLMNYDYQKMRKYSFWLLVVSAVSLGLVFIPGIGARINGAARWIKIGSVSIQPSEFVKLVLILYMANFLSRKKGKEIEDYKEGFLPIILVLSMISFLILIEPDLGTVILLILIVFTMALIGGVRLAHVFSFVPLGIPALVIEVMLHPHQQQRIKDIFNAIVAMIISIFSPKTLPQVVDIPYQIWHSLIAIGSGGLWGRGLGNSIQKTGYLPDCHTDFIFSILCEECGFIGATFVIMAFLFLAWHCFRVAIRSSDVYASLLATGITILFLFQLCVNLGTVSRMIPAKGMPIPFISYGGSSMLVSLMAIGIMLNLAQYIRIRISIKKAEGLLQIMMQKKFNLIISGGGTGGHIYPAIAIAEEFIRNHENAIIHYVGKSGGREEEIVARCGLPIIFHGIRAQGIPRRVSPEIFKAIYRTILGFIEAMKLIKDIRPKVVVGTGGYVSAAAVLAAQWKGIPTMIHEQNAYPGITNRILSKKAKYIVTFYPEMHKYFPEDKIRVTGNPVRKEFSNLNKNVSLQEFGFSSDKPTLLVFGGSQGSLAINRAAAKAIQILDYKIKGIQVLIQTGDIGFAETKEALTGLKNTKVLVQPYFHNMFLVYGAADLIIFRAGAISISEITICGLPSILIPYPYASENHQEKNARLLESAGAAAVILEKDLSPEKLSGEIERILNNNDLYQQMAEASRALAKPNAAKRICSLIESLVVN